MYKEISRGDIWYAKFPRQERQDSCIQSGTRPVVVTQNDNISKYSTTVVVADLTSKTKRMDLAYHILLPWIKGLPKRSTVLAEQRFTLDQKDLFDYRCTPDDVQMKRIERAIRIVEFAANKTKQRHRRK